MQCAEKRCVKSVIEFIVMQWEPLSLPLPMSYVIQREPLCLICYLIFVTHGEPLSLSLFTSYAIQREPLCSIC